MIHQKSGDRTTPLPGDRWLVRQSGWLSIKARYHGRWLF